MRLRGTALLAGIAAGVAAVLVLAGPAAAANLHCGQTLTSSVTLIGNLDCSGYGGTAIIIGHDGVTLNLGGNSITGASGFDVIDNYTDSTHPYDGTTIQGGTLYVSGSGYGVDNQYGGYGLTVAGVYIHGDSSSTSSEGIDSEGSDGLTVSGGSIDGVYYGVYLYDETGDLIKGEKITTYDGGYGVYSDEHLTNVSIVGNTFTSDDGLQTGYAYYAQYDAGTVFSGNTVTAMEYGVYDSNYSAGLQITGNVLGGPSPGTGNDYGIYFDGYGSGNIISGNYIRNSSYNAVADYDSFNSTYTGNIATANGRVSNTETYYIYANGYGPVTMVNNIARVGDGYGFYVYRAYNDSVPGGPYSLFSGNTSLANGSGNDPGFYDEYSVGATWTNNVAMANAYEGFWFYEPWRETITNNKATQNGNDGFYFEGNSDKYQPLAVTNNTATYNGGYGFNAEYPAAGSGNTTGGTNGSGQCYLVAGCS